MMTRVSAVDTIPLMLRHSYLFALCAAGLCLANAVHAQQFPARPIRFIVPFQPGAGSDITARTVANNMSELLGQQVVVDNRPGASGNIGLELIARAAPDGYTVALMSATVAVNSVVQKLPFDLLRDFTPVSQMTSQPYCLTIHPAIPAKSAREFIDLIRAKPNFYTYGSSGTGGLSHLSGALMASMAKINWIHVPYKGGAPGITDMLGGQIHSQFATIIGTAAHVKAGKLRWLAVSTIKRSAAVPDLPTMSEAALPGFDINGWYGMLAPAALPKPVLAALNRSVQEALKAPDVGPRFALDGSEPVGSASDAFAAHIKREVVKYAKVTKDAGMNVD
jgi:tripartite-type tricarboxylate transporter receptor subunit TctC